MAPTHTFERLRHRQLNSSRPAARVRTLVFLIGIAAIGSNCDRSPVEPTPAPGPQTSAASITNVVIGGPMSVAPGESPRYTATAQYSDGSSKDVTATAQWNPPSDRNWLPIYFTSPGVAADAKRGEITVSAIAGGKVGFLNVLVLEPGTYKLKGEVSESGVGSLVGATVEVLSGTGQGLQATTNRQGYALYGVAGPVRVRASAEGFTPQVHDVVVTESNVTETFALTPVDPPTDVSGVWTMTVAPSPSCRTGLPDIARGRTYQLQLIQHGTRFQVQISSPTLQVFNPGQNYGTIFGSLVQLQFIGDTDYGEWSTPDIYDHLSPTEKFGFDGRVDGTVAGTAIGATMNGDLVYWDAPTFGPAWYCRAKDHIVSLRR